MLHKFARHCTRFQNVQCKNVTIKAMIADTEETRQRGLAGVSTLPDNCGMLFDFGVEQPTSFWMKGCSQDLSIAFITKHGVIVDIQEMSTNNPTRLHHSPTSVRYALEANKGFFTRHNIVPGDKISF